MVTAPHAASGCGIAPPDTGFPRAAKPPLTRHSSVPVGRYTSPFRSRVPRKRATLMQKERCQPRTVVLQLSTNSKPGFHSSEP